MDTSYLDVMFLVRRIKFRQRLGCGWGVASAWPVVRGQGAPGRCQGAAMVRPAAARVRSAGPS
jgi:hypothetical protein